MGAFQFKELRVWKKAVDFADLAIGMSESLNTPRNHFRLIEQFEAASASVAMNIAEGKGRRSKKEFVRFLYIARGSLFEVVTLAVIFKKRKWISENDLKTIESAAEEIGSMLNALINAITKSL